MTVNYYMWLSNLLYFCVCWQMIAEASLPSTMVLPPCAKKIAQVMVVTITPVACQRSRRLIRNPYVDNEATEGNEDNSVFGCSHSTTKSTLNMPIILICIRGF